MSFLDLETILFRNIISSAACVIIAWFLWLQNHKRFSGLGFWLLYSCLQLVSFFLLALRGVIPAFFTVVLSNVLIMCATLSVYVGLARFFGLPAARLLNIAIIIVFMLVHVFLTYGFPSLKLRGINVALGLLVICVQAAWLLLVRVGAEARRTALPSGVIFLIFCLISAGRAVFEIILPPAGHSPGGDFFNNLSLLLYQILTIILVFNLFLMVNRRLIAAQAREIAERTRTEKLLQASLNEKEVLLRELYHRTKNNMQVISSLLALEAGKLGNEEASRILNDMDFRVKSMALVHQKLYQSRNLSRLDLGEYVRELVTLIMDMHAAKEGRVTVEFDCQSIPVLIDSAVPVGLIVNEIVSNSLKHAFPGDRPGEIRVEVGKTDAGAIRLGIADNGIGLVPERDLRASGSLGMQIIFGVARHQLGAEVAYESKEGLRWSVEFRDDRYQPRVEA